jgi:hypothetical protein
MKHLPPRDIGQGVSRGAADGLIVVGDGAFVVPMESMKIAPEDQGIGRPWLQAYGLIQLAHSGGVIAFRPEGISALIVRGGMAR